MKKTILITGATGQQGGSVLKHLLEDDAFSIRAMVRNAHSPAAQNLQNLDVEIIEGDFDNLGSLEVALNGVYGVFSVQNYWAVGYEDEIRQGKNIAEAAKKVNVQHFIQSTMADGKTLPQDVPHFLSKAKIEQYIKEIELPTTLLGTVNFMDNFINPKMGGAWTFPFLSGVFRPDVPYHMLAVDDIGGIVQNVFSDPQYIGKKINVASECLTVSELKKVYQEVAGKKSKRIVFPKFVCKLLNAEFVEQLEWQNLGNWTHTQEETKKIYQNITSFTDFLKNNNVKNL